MDLDGLWDINIDGFEYPMYLNDEGGVLSGWGRYGRLGLGHSGENDEGTHFTVSGSRQGNTLTFTKIVLNCMVRCSASVSSRTEGSNGTWVTEELGKPAVSGAFHMCRQSGKGRLLGSARGKMWTAEQMGMSSDPGPFCVELSSVRRN